MFVHIEYIISNALDLSTVVSLCVRYYIGSTTSSLPCTSPEASVPLRAAALTVILSHTGMPGRRRGPELAEGPNRSVVVILSSSIVSVSVIIIMITIVIAIIISINIVVIITIILVSECAPRPCARPRTSERGMLVSLSMCWLLRLP
jgi:hypothetical protein